MNEPDLAAAFIAYADRLRRYLRHLVRADDVEDALSDVFESAWRHRASYEDRGHQLSAWLYTIARSKAIDQRRRYLRDQAIPLLPAHARIDGPEEQIGRELMHAWLRDCIMRCLVDDQRRVIWLRFVEDQTLAETAAHLKTTEGAVKSLQHRAVARLRLATAPDDMPSMMVAFAAATPLQPKKQPRPKEPPANSRSCAASGCQERARFRDGYCFKHHARFQAHGDVADRFRNAGRPCAAEGCTRPARSHGYCTLHYQRQRVAVRPCSVPGCERPRHVRSLCLSHFEERRQASRVGN
jgi:RNA polymerase sigma-70 factor (ECF subfamily)